MSCHPSLNKISMIKIRSDNTDFIFIGPDSPPPYLNDIHSYIEVSRTIREMGMPNYRMARFPIESGLNIDSWAKYLKDYSNKKLLQYLTYGFPILSLILIPWATRILLTTFLPSSFQGLWISTSKKKYHLGQCWALLSTLIAHTSMFPITHQTPKNNRRRVILNLSYPAGTSLNVTVTKDLFDDLHFTLKFPTVDNILESVRGIKGRVMLEKKRHF